MRQFLPILFACLFLKPVQTKAQFESFKDSVVQLYGLVMTADSLKGLESVSVVVKGQNRGTVTNDKGVFSIVVLKGDEIEFSSVGYKPKTISISKSLEGNQQSVIQLMVNDTVYLPATIIKARPTREQFERDFLNNPVADDDIAIARKNTDVATRRLLLANMPVDGREASAQYLRQISNKAYYAGQAPPQNIFNPFAWAEFIKAWKRGDFKKKDTYRPSSSTNTTNSSTTPTPNDIYKPKH
ncbi:MAG: carboxypeptidase-like regulatory domain-containing protein [Bacteroidetes bacterium]|nr:carboxypeptidase-like regulatory domain-containing protein [Bacteroidota bacterium]